MYTKAPSDPIPIYAHSFPPTQSKKEVRKKNSRLGHHTALAAGHAMRHKEMLPPPSSFSLLLHHRTLRLVLILIAHSPPTCHPMFLPTPSTPLRIHRVLPPLLLLQHSFSIPCFSFQCVHILFRLPLDRRRNRRAPLAPFPPIDRLLMVVMPMLALMPA